MSDYESLFKIIPSIYAVPGNHNGWDKVLKEVNDLVGAAASVYMLVEDQKSCCNHLSAYYGYSEADRKIYEGGQGAQRDVRMQYVHNLIPGQAFREFEYIPDKALYDASEWIQYERQQRGIYWNLAARISTHNLWLDIISFDRLEKNGPYSDAEKGALQSLLPHLARAAELHRTATRLQEIYGAVMSVLNKLLVGLVILDTNGDVMLLNSAAQRTAEETGALRIRVGSGIYATDAATESNLQKLIAMSLQTVNAEGTSAGGQLTVPSRVAGESLLLDLMPVSDEGLVESDNIRGVAIFIIDPNRSKIFTSEGMTRIFALSPTEGVIAQALINGDKPNDIAEQRSTTFETVRSQIKSIYNKTGSNSLGDLVRLAVKLNPPIELNTVAADHNNENQG